MLISCLAKRDKKDTPGKATWRPETDAKKNERETRRETQRKAEETPERNAKKAREQTPEK